MNYEIQFARVTNTGKLSDRFLACQNIDTQDLAKTQMGKGFVMVEILSPWFPTAQIGQMIISNFPKYYYQGGSTSDLVNFENTLKKINEDLAQVTQNGETEWIGNLNGLLAIIVGNNLHLASSGRVEGYLFREGKILRLIDKGEGEPHPLKTFANITSGELKPHDKILLANKELFDHLSLESLKQIITLNHPSGAASQTTRLLSKRKVRKVNAIIINLLAIEEIAGAPLSQTEPTVYYLDKSSEPAWRRFIVLFSLILIPFSRLVGEKTKKIAKQSFLFIERLRKRRRSGEEKKEPVPASSQERKIDKFHQEFISGDPRDDSLLKDESIQYSPDLYVHYYQEKKKVKKSLALKIIQGIRGGLAGLIGFTRKLWQNKQQRKYLYIILAIIFILTVILVVKLSENQSQVGNLEAQKILDEAIASQKEGKNLLVQGSQEKAKEQFVASIDKARGIKSNSFVSKDAQAVLTQSFQELDKLTSTTRYSNLSPLVTVGQAAKGLFVVSGEAYLITESDIFKASLIGSTPSKIASFPKGKGNFLTGTRAGNLLYLYLSDQTLFELDSASEKLTQAKIAEEGRWETASALAYYVGSIYLLDGIVGQIYKHPSSEEEFQEGQEYISPTSVDLKNALSLAIDGSLYVLKNNGQVVKIQRSKPQDFTLKNIPTPHDEISEPRKIYTDTDTPSIYILDNSQKRILEFDKDGQFLHQYALPDEWEKITDFAVSFKSRKMWLLEKNNLYEIAF